MRTTQNIKIVGMLAIGLGVASVAHAEAPSAEKLEVQKARARDHAGFMKRREFAKNNRRKVFAPAPKLLDRTSDVVGTLIDARDGGLMMATPVDSKQKETMLKMGFREVSELDLSRPQDRVIYNGQLYRTFMVHKDQGPKDWELRKYKGQRVTIRFQQMSTGPFVAVGLKAAPKAKARK